MGETLKVFLHDVGVLKVTVERQGKDISDHEIRLRGLEHLTAKVVGGAIVGSALGGWILSQLGACVG